MEVATHTVASTRLYFEAALGDDEAREPVKGEY